MPLRERLISWLASAFTWTALRVAPKPDVPSDFMFRVDLGGQLNSVLFFVPASLGEWHVVTMVRHPGEKRWLMDSAVGRCWAWPIDDDVPLEAVLRGYKPDFVVMVTSEAKGEFVHSTIGPVTCVTLAKRLIGLHNPGIVTSRQLLAKLWELHDGRT